MLSQNSAIQALYCDKDHMSQNSACRNIVLSQYSAGTVGTVSRLVNGVAPTNHELRSMAALEVHNSNMPFPSSTLPNS